MDLIDEQKLVAGLAPLFDNMTVRIIQAIKDGFADIAEKKLTVTLETKNEKPS